METHICSKCGLQQKLSEFKYKYDICKECYLTSQIFNKNSVFIVLTEYDPTLATYLKSEIFEHLSNNTCAIQRTMKYE
jgi:hypothetical protein